MHDLRCIFKEQIKMIFCIRLLVMFVLVLSVATQPIKNVYAAAQQIVAVVNDDAISGRDLSKRMKLILASSGLKNSKEIRAKMMPQVLNNLINEQLMLQEARKMGIQVERTDIESGFAKIAAQNKSTADKFKSMLRRGGIDVSTMYSQIEAQVAWSRVVQARLRPRVIVSDRDVDDVLERINAKVGSKEYLTAEIFIPTDSKNSEKQVKQLSDRLVREIKSGKASFFKLAQQFSRSAGAVKGGDTGWVQETQISEELLAGLQSVKKNQVTKPIKTLRGYHIIFLRDIRTLTSDTMPSRDQIYYSLGAERLEKLQMRHLMDLKAASFVEVRV